MSDRAAFVAAIEADPGNDLPRLLWADWLADHLDIEGRTGPTDWSPQALIQAVAHTPAFATLRSLRLYNVGLEADDLRALIASPYLPAALDLELMAPTWTRSGRLWDELVARFPDAPPEW